MTKACPRCGIPREVNESRDHTDTLCRDCKVVEADLANMPCPLGVPGHRRYRAHKQLGEYPCEACSEFVILAAQQYRRRKGIPPRLPTECGTIAGRSLHSRRGEEPCAPCKAAQAAYAREYRARKREAA